MFSVMRGIGEMDVNQPPAESSRLPVDDSCPYLILDIRDRDEYDACHLISGRYYKQILLESCFNVHFFMQIDNICSVYYTFSQTSHSSE